MFSTEPKVFIGGISSDFNRAKLIELAKITP
jgi:hypothetical protein